MNFLYCFDKNFNLQALNSINSIIKNSQNNKINFYIIHDSPESFLRIVNRYLYIYKDRIKIYKFDFDSIQFPNIEKTHISRATYFRLFFQKYLPENIDFITYIDSDIICLSNPIKKIQESTKKICKDELLLGAVTDGDQHNENKIRLGLENEKYFNAGVMIINLKQWKKKIEITEIINCMESLKDRILWWDQDVLNVLVDGNYLELGNDFNMKVSELNGRPADSIIFLHYSGKGKPWGNSIFDDERSDFYQHEFKTTGFSEYHVDPGKLKESVLFFKYLLFNKNNKLNKKKLFQSFLKKRFLA